jgi:putative transcriptional regulator
MAAIHETVEALQKVGVVDRKTMRHFDDACLISVRPLSPLQIKKK